jgi:predicted DNA-binding protein (MmcQ/YjbR family)
MSPIERVRSLCLALPEAFERETWDHPTFRVGGGRGKIFCTAAPDGSHITLKAEPLEREALLAQGGPYFVPAYVGDKGWLGIRLDDAGTDSEEAAELIATSYCLIAPKRLSKKVTRPLCSTDNQPLAAP